MRCGCAAGFGGDAVRSQTRSGTAPRIARRRDSRCCPDRCRGRDSGFPAARPAVDFGAGAYWNDAGCGEHCAQAGQADSARVRAGAGVVLAVMILFGVIPLKITMLVPVGSMVIANTMNTQSLFLDRLRGEVTSHVGEIESALALGASADADVMPYL